MQSLAHAAAHDALVMISVLVALWCPQVVVVVVLLMIIVNTYYDADTDADASGTTAVGAPPTNGHQHRQVTRGDRGGGSLYGSIGAPFWRRSNMVVKMAVVGKVASQRPAIAVYDGGGVVFRARTEFVPMLEPAATTHAALLIVRSVRHDLVEVGTCVWHT